ncbi:MAG TPA: hypothetical protein VI233_02710, partial [Puia sp.]
MRTELETIARIEQYIKGEMSAEEKAAFENEISADAQLKEKVLLQQEIMKGIERASLRGKVLRASVRYRRGRNFRNWGGMGLGTVVLVMLLVVLLKKSVQPVFHTMQQQPSATAVVDTFPGALNSGSVDSSTRRPVSRDRSLSPQVFLIDGARDTVVETKGGMVLSIPAGGFLGADGRPVKGGIQLVLREALDAATIIRAGLSTVSDGHLLETGGMFFIDALKDGASLRVDSSKGIYAEVPTDVVRPGMQVFTGKVGANGIIDWQNPRPLEHNLIPRDIFSLDFYPPYYLDSLASWGYNIRDKAFTDSLYYSLTTLFHEGYTVPVSVAAGGMKEQVTDSTADRVVRDTVGTPPMRFHLNCGIDPAKIKAIWNRNFENTFIATREFEERLRWMHENTAGEADFLEFYIRNLDK